MVAQPHWLWPEEIDKQDSRETRARTSEENQKALPNYWPKGNVECDQNRSFFQSNFSICVLTQSLSLILVLGELSLVIFAKARLTQSYSNVPAKTMSLYLFKNAEMVCQAGNSI